MPRPVLETVDSYLTSHENYIKLDIFNADNYTLTNSLIGGSSVVSNPLVSVGGQFLVSIARKPN